MSDLSIFQRAAEFARLPDTFALLHYTPNPKQAVFHDATEYDVLYGGAKGGGKTVALLAEGLRACQQFEGLRAAGFRRSYPELSESLLKALAEFNFARALGASWNGTDRVLTFPNRSTFRFRYAENILDASRYQGGEIGYLLIDERTQMSPDVVEILKESLRSGSGGKKVLGIRSSCNPGGVGHGTIKDEYILPTNYGANIIYDSQGRAKRFIPATVRDNLKNVGEDYLLQLQSISDPIRRSMMLDGNWDVAEGMFFTEWNQERHIVPRFEIPKEWRRYSGTDFGYAAPWATEWIAVDNDGRVWVYRERYMKKVRYEDQALMIRDDEKMSDETDQVLHYADPSGWNSTGEGMPFAEVYAREGVALTKAVNDRIPGWQRVHSYLAEYPVCAHHKELGWETCPKLHVLEGCAPGLVKELPNLPFDRNRVEDVDTKAPDHASDALRYVLMTFEGGASFPIFEEEKKKEEESIISTTPMPGNRWVMPGAFDHNSSVGW